MTRRALRTGWATEGAAAGAVLVASSLLWLSPYWAVLTVPLGIALGLWLPRSLSVIIGGLAASALSIGLYAFADLPTNLLLNWLVLVLVMGMLPFTITRAWVLRSVGMATADSLVRARSAGRAAATAHAHSEEKRRIAEDLHDDLGHQLSLVSLQISALSVDPDLSAEQKQSLAEVHRRLGESVASLSRTVDLLRSDGHAPRSPGRPPSGPVSETGAEVAAGPSMTAEVAAGPSMTAEVAAGSSAPTSETGDPATLDRLFDDVAAAGADVTISAEDRTLLGSLPEHSFVGRFVKESLTNALRHAPGQPIDVSADSDVSTDSGDELHLRVTNPLAASAKRSARQGTGISALQSAARHLGGRVVQTISGTEHSIELVIPAAEISAPEAPAARSLPDDAERSMAAFAPPVTSASAPTDPASLDPASLDPALLGPEAIGASDFGVTGFDDPTLVYASARSKGNRRILLAVVVPFVLLAIVLSGTLAKNWYDALESLASPAALRRIVPGSTEAGARGLLPDEEYRLTDQQRAAALEGAPAGSDCHFYAVTADLLADESGDVLRICYADELVASVDTVMTRGER